MSKNTHGMGLRVPIALVVVISLLLAFAAKKERPQHNQTPLEALAQVEGALKRTGMPWF